MAAAASLGATADCLPLLPRSTPQPLDLSHALLRCRLTAPPRPAACPSGPQGAIKPLCDLLSCSDARIVTVALEGLENILKVGCACCVALVGWAGHRRYCCRVALGAAAASSCADD